MTYGNPVLRKQGHQIKEKTSEIDELIDNMFQTLHNANGIGLTANQVNKQLSLFIIDFNGETLGEENLKEVFINSEIIEYSNEEEYMEEGCLSLPSMFEEIKRPKTITIKYLDENFIQRIVTYTDILARVIQHEYDHTKGMLYVDRIQQLRKKLIANKLQMILKKKFNVKYLTK